MYWQDLYNKILNLLGQQIGADVTSEFRGQNEHEVKKAGKNLKHLPFLLKTKLLFWILQKEKENTTFRTDKLHFERRIWPNIWNSSGLQCLWTKI